MGYEPDEMCRRDKFVSPYMGKEYPDGNHTEILSMGLEYLFFNKEGFWRRNPEYAKFVLGILLGV